MAERFFWIYTLRPHKQLICNCTMRAGEVVASGGTPIRMIRMLYKESRAKYLDDQ